MFLVSQIYATGFTAFLVRNPLESSRQFQMIVEWSSTPNKESYITQIVTLIEQGFQSKFAHVGLSTEETIELLKGSFEVDAGDPYHQYGLVLEGSQVLGVCHLYLPTGPKKAHDFSPLWAQYPWYRRIRISKLQVLLDNASIELKPSEAYVSMIVVSELARGKGVGKQLLDWADKKAKDLGFSAITLFVASSNRAKALYERQGYVEDKKRSITGLIAGSVVYVLMGESGSYFMVKQLL
jgi:ribosomal protein S18 acetylase RimI-like enzyme